MNIKNSISIFLLIFPSILCAEPPPDKNQFEILGYESCMSAKQLSHVQGQSWQIAGSDPNWKIHMDNQKKDSPLTHIPDDATVVRELVLSAPAFFGMMTKVTCNYHEGTVILVRYYDMKETPYPAADFIAADDRINDGTWGSTLLSDKTTCSTDVGALDKCKWAFIRRVKSAEILPGLPL